MHCPRSSSPPSPRRYQPPRTSPASPPCKESKAFAKRQKQSVKELENSLKKYATDSAPALAIKARKEAYDEGDHHRGGRSLPGCCGGATFGRSCHFLHLKIASSWLLSSLSMN
ncbi:photosystem I reaction center subunit III, chloroplastic [Canna indica]|uniref:Photosystem I reaction center subunit III n=1 Tax=Canna indica TaxID=4628 RepID=A0AAQ3K1U4_9LILI|nr:photosystem I reaction center subunit III, chloroplastic [Canna indica]